MVPSAIKLTAWLRPSNARSSTDPTHTLTGNAKYLNTVQFSPTHGDKIVSGTDMGSLLVWKVKGITGAEEGDDGIAANLPVTGRNMVARKRNAEARIANTQAKLDKDRSDGDAEISKLRCVCPLRSLRLVRILALLCSQTTPLSCPAHQKVVWGVNHCMSVCGMVLSAARSWRL